MFIEFVNRKNETISLNAAYILFVTSDKKGAVVFDIEGLDYELKESYEEFMARLGRIDVNDLG